jgi:Fe2+ or Zn2+ uptake regulation protein
MLSDIASNLIGGAGGHIDVKELYRRASSKGKFISLATVNGLRLFKELVLGVNNGEQNDSGGKVTMGVKNNDY